MSRENLTTTDEGIRRVQRRRGKDEWPTTETVGDPDEASPEGTGQASAAAGALLGAAVAGPLGMVAGAAIGGAGGTLAEKTDGDEPREWDQAQKQQELDEHGSRR